MVSNILVAFCKVYNSVRFGLGRMMDSIDRQIDRVIVGDGWFPWDEKRYPFTNKGASSDTTEAVARKYPNVDWLPAPEGGYKSEVEKHNAMLRRIPDGAWVLMIDPDERLVGSLGQYIGSLGVETDIVPMRVSNEGGSLYYNRCFRYREGMFFRTHSSITYPREATVNLYLGSLPETIYLYHDRHD